jgi:hypothetical protein
VRGRRRDGPLSREHSGQNPFEELLKLAIGPAVAVEETDPHTPDKVQHLASTTREGEEAIFVRSILCLRRVSLWSNGRPHLRRDGILALGADVHRSVSRPGSRFARLFLVAVGRGR